MTEEVASSVTARDIPFGYGYEEAYGVARGQVKSISDFHRQCRNSGADYMETASGETAAIKFMDKISLVGHQDADVSLKDGSELQLQDKILILHYFLQAKGTPSAGKLITFRELPEGMTYFRTFSQRVIGRLLAFFGKEPELLLAAAESLGGRKAEPGDASVTIDAFPRVPVTFVVWTGDDEFPASASVLLDAGVNDYLSTYDVVVLCDSINRELIDYVKNRGKPS